MSAGWARPSSRGMWGWLRSAALHPSERCWKPSPGLTKASRVGRLQRATEHMSPRHWAPHIQSQRTLDSQGLLSLLAATDSACLEAAAGAELLLQPRGANTADPSVSRASELSGRERRAAWRARHGSAGAVGFEPASASTAPGSTSTNACSPPLSTAHSTPTASPPSRRTEAAPSSPPVLNSHPIQQQKSAAAAADELSQERHLRRMLEVPPAPSARIVPVGALQSQNRRARVGWQCIERPSAWTDAPLARCHHAH